jgi:uncharacterized protein YigA (DUF484 family)
MSPVSNDDQPKTLSKDQVISYLESHPDLLAEYPELLTKMTPPARSLGNNVVDFQQFQLKNLQENTRDMKGRMDSLLEYCRGTISVQGQVNEVVLRILRSKNLEQLIEVLAIDLPNVLMVDVARLVIESDDSAIRSEDIEGMYHSGLTLVPKDTVMLSIGHSPHQFMADINTEGDELLGEIISEVFGGAAPIVKSAAFISVPMATVEHSVMLALGVRTSGRFKAGPTAAPLDFLAAVIASQLDRYLHSLDI